MAYTVQQFGDLENIRMVKHRCFRGADTADLRLPGTLFRRGCHASWPHPEITHRLRNGLIQRMMHGRNSSGIFAAGC